MTIQNAMENEIHQQQILTYYLMSKSTWWMLMLQNIDDFLKCNDKNVILAVLNFWNCAGLVTFYCFWQSIYCYCIIIHRIAIKKIYVIVCIFIQCRRTYIYSKTYWHILRAVKFHPKAISRGYSPPIVYSECNY